MDNPNTKSENVVKRQRLNNDEVYVIVDNETYSANVYHSKDDLVKYLVSCNFPKSEEYLYLHRFINGEDDVKLGQGGVPLNKFDNLQYICKSKIH